MENKNIFITPKTLAKSRLPLINKSMTGLADELGITRQRLHQLLTTGVGPSKRKEQIAQALGMEVSDLWPN